MVLPQSNNRPSTLGPVLFYNISNQGHTVHRESTDVYGNQFIHVIENASDFGPEWLAQADPRFFKNWVQQHFTFVRPKPRVSTTARRRKTLRRDSKTRSGLGQGNAARRRLRPRRQTPQRKKNV